MDLGGVLAAGLPWPRLLPLPSSMSTSRSAGPGNVKHVEQHTRVDVRPVEAQKQKARCSPMGWRVLSWLLFSASLRRLISREAYTHEHTPYIETDMTQAYIQTYIHTNL
jgi:hypothetical protein